MAFAQVSLCPGIILMEGKVKLNNNEKVLVCGATDEAVEAWSNIPRAQAEFHLRTILGNLGYFSPRLKQSPEGLEVWAGPLTKTHRLTIEGSELILNPDRKRKIIGEPLIPKKLNEVKAWSDLEIQSRGYACAKNTIVAEAWNNTIIVQSQVGSRMRFGKVEFDQLEGLDDDVLDRYQPFSEGEWYDVRKTQLMTGRMLSDGLFQSAYFITECENTTALLKLETSVGKPKILRIGIGASTEEFPFIDLSFRNAKLDEKASSYTLSFHASPPLTSLSGISELYLFPGWNRVFLGPRFRVAKEVEASYETNTARAGIDIGRRWDMWDLRMTGLWGPTLNYSKTVRGVGPGDVTYPTFEGSLQIMSHLYEYLIREQYEGWTFSFYYRGQNQGLGSQVDVNRYQTDLKILWNLGGYSPPLWVLGTRIESIVVDAKGIDTENDRVLLPVEDRIFLGGDRDLRGFPRQSLDNGGLGYLTSFYLGLELRLIQELPFGLQPFVLWDAARLGENRYELDGSLYISEGIGLRWASPFGTLRGTAAKGRIWKQDISNRDYPQRWVYFLSFGQEF